MRRLLISLVLAISALALGATPVVARHRHHHGGKGAPEGAQKVPLFGPFVHVLVCPTGGPPTANTFGFAILDTPGNETRVSGVVAVKGAQPNTEYVVGVVESENGSNCTGAVAGELHTNRVGNGNLEFNVERRPGATMFFASVARPTLLGGKEQFASSPVELD